MKQATEPVRDPRDAMPGLNHELAELLLQMLNMDPNHRPADWCGVYDALFAIYEKINAAKSKGQIRLSSGGSASKQALPTL